MTRLNRWNLILPLAHFTIAVCLWLYIPFQFGNRMLETMKLSPDQVFGRNLDLSPQAFEWYFPPPAGRTLYAVNFPAYVLSRQLQKAVAWRIVPALQFTIQNPVRGLPILYTVGIREVTFFMAVCLIWWWVGTKIDEFGQKSRGQKILRPPRWPTAQLIAILLLSILLLRKSWLCLTSAASTTPERQIMTFGLIWPAALLVYFCLQLRSKLKHRKGSQP